MEDKSDQTIVFNANGECNYCTDALAGAPTIYFPNVEGEKKIREFVGRIRAINKNRKYDCIMGLSGGLDSSYLAYLGHKWGLRILGVHIDDGFDTEISKENIRKLSKFCNIELVIVKPNAEQFYSLTKAYMYAGVPNIAVPQDNVCTAELYKIARTSCIRHLLSGENYALECILQMGNTHSSLDIVNIKSINKKCGSKSINKLNLISYMEVRFYSAIKKIEIINPLNYLEYNRDKAINELKEFCGYEYYGRKHLENWLTAFIQLYWFYNKFGVDKRTSHLSSMIISGQMTRDAALKEMEKPIYEPLEMERIIDMVICKIGMTREELNKIMLLPSHQHTDYRTSRYTEMLRNAKAKINRVFK